MEFELCSGEGLLPRRLPFVKQKLKEAGYPVVYSEFTQYGMTCRLKTGEQAVVINPRLAPFEEGIVLAHEAGHAFLGHLDLIREGALLFPGLAPQEGDRLPEPGMYSEVENSANIFASQLLFGRALFRNAAVGDASLDDVIVDMAWKGWPVTALSVRLCRAVFATVEMKRETLFVVGRNI